MFELDFAMIELGNAIQHSSIDPTSSSENIRKYWLACAATTFSQSVCYRTACSQTLLPYREHISNFVAESTQISWTLPVLTLGKPFSNMFYHNLPNQSWTSHTFMKIEWAEIRTLKGTTQIHPLEKINVEASTSKLLFLRYTRHLNFRRPLRGFKLTRN